jgi:SAM-dependent methyltransferase
LKDRRLYDSISGTYRSTRCEEARVARHIHAALGNADRVVNVGAGTGNYEPRDRFVVAVEPSAAMVSARSRSASAVQGVAEALPLPAASFDVAMASLTLHHWSDLRKGLMEMRRVAPRQVILMFDPAEISRFWALGYWPEALGLPSEADAPGPGQVAEVLDVTEVRTVPIPIDCTDGFGAAYWGRPKAYLDPDVQQGMSWLAQLPADNLAKGASRLAEDLQSGAWEERHGHLLTRTEFDVGFRVVMAGPRT